MEQTYQPHRIYNAVQLNLLAASSCVYSGYVGINWLNSSLEHLLKQNKKSAINRLKFINENTQQSNYITKGDKQ